MSSSHSLPGLKPPAKISVSTFVGLLWGGVVVAFLCFVMRIYVRIKSFRRVFWDDFLVLIAWLMLVATAIIWHYAKVGLYVLLGVQSGQQRAPPDFDTKAGRYLHLSAAVIILFYSSLWCVKLSFLIFFRRLGRNVRRQKLIWWSVLTVVVASYFATLGTPPYRCMLPRFEVIAKNCGTPSAAAYQRAQFKATTAIDVFSDAIIMLVPLNMLWRVQLSFRRKLGLAGIFSLTVFIMIIAIVRVAIVYDDDRAQADGAWLYTWSMIEQTVAIIVACLASFRALFTQQDRSQRISEEKDLSNNSKKTKSSVALRSMETTSNVLELGSKSSRHFNDDASSDQNLKPSSNNILVRQEFEVVSNARRPHEVV